MEDYIQFSAKTKNEAITKACLELGTSSDQLDIQVISEGSSGFFGIGSKPAVIKVRRIEPVSDMQEIDALVESVKLDAVKEIVRMGELARKDVRLGMEAIQSFDADKVKYVLEHEPVVDALERDITDYLTQMSSSEMSESLTTRHTGLLHACTDIERIGDHGETLAKRARKLVEEDVVFSDEAKAELLQLSEMVLRASGRALEALEKNDKAIAEDAVRLCREVKQYQKEIRKNHITRLNEHICNPTAGFVMMELLINMKRVSDHSKNIAQLVQGTF